MADFRRCRYQDEDPKVGDVVELFDGAFGAGIVTSVRDGMAEVERVHAAVGFGQIEIGVERTTFSLAALRDRRVFTRGPSGEVDNRRRDR